MTSTKSDQTVSVLSTWSSLPSLRQFWEQQCTHPNAEYRLFYETLRSRKEVIRPNVLVVASDGEPKAAVLCRIENAKCPIRLGYLNFGTITVRTIVVMHGGVLGDLDSTGAQGVVRHLMEALRRGEASRILVSATPENSSFVVAALRQSTDWSRGYMQQRSKHWWIDIPSSQGTFIAGMKSKHRNYLRRMQRSLEERFAGDVVCRKYKDPRDVVQALGDIETVACKTYQRGLGVGVRNNKEYADRFKAVAEAGNLRVWVLYGGGSALAFRVGTICGDTIHGAGTGFDPELSEYRVGTLLLIHAIDDLAAEGIHRYDLGIGDAAYKQQLGSGCWDEVSFSIFGCSTRAQVAKAAIIIPLQISRVLTGLLVRFNAVERVKRILRRRAQSTAAKAAPLS